MSSLSFYTTSGCHLCEQAELIFNQYGYNLSEAIKPIDIADDDGLVELYGIRIPVLKRGDTGAELGWPFDLDDLIQFLE
ncbi:MAG: hypothetical protein COA74_01870 [Gammaproteobacteria bacterium]|nr:MAG: hypothetical protein COA74_01870 [Gammaproteobacteria bacterium]